MLTSLINGYVSQFYSFAYSLIPDELQAQQLVIDAISASLLSNKDRYSRELLVIDSNIKLQIKLEILLMIYKIGFRRDTHFKTNQFIKDRGENGRFDLFYTFSVKKRGLLHLRTHLDLSIDAIAKVVSSSKVDVLKDLSVLKVHLEDNIYESI